LILCNEQSLKDWAIKHQMPTPEDAHYLGQVLDNEIRAVVVYCGFYGKSCMIHVGSVGQHWMTKQFLKEVFNYPFNSLKLKVIIGTVAGSNKKALKLNRHLGFKDVAIIPDAHEDGDLVILEMRPEYCKWA
jgi:RimJ/RimL family protein N-acetyltransferase